MERMPETASYETALPNENKEGTEFCTVKETELALVGRRDKELKREKFGNVMKGGSDLCLHRST